jgi:hypothetical protein
MVPDLDKISDPEVWRVVNGTVSASADGGKHVRLAPIGGNRKGSNVALALVQGVELEEGALEIDLLGGGADQASFLGVAFGVASPEVHEAVYFRPFNFRSDDPIRRAHAVQYVAWPGHTWEKLRNDHPGVYESAVVPVPDPATWFHARVEVTAKRVSVFVNHAARPCLAVDRLGSAGKGGVGLWVDSQEGGFANFSISPSP